MAITNLNQHFHQTYVQFKHQKKLNKSGKLKQYEPRHDKTNKMSVRPAKTQISLGICPVCSESSLCAQWVAKDPRFLRADREDADQTWRMPRLIWVFAGRTLILLILLCRGSYFWHLDGGHYIACTHKGFILDVVLCVWYLFPFGIFGRMSNWTASVLDPSFHILSSKRLPESSLAHCLSFYFEFLFRLTKVKKSYWTFLGRLFFWYNLPYCQK